jgi:ATP-dependent Lon protease
LSKILFIASCNDLSRIDPVLRDRLKIIRLPELTLQNKLKIIEGQIIPELMESMAMDPSTLSFSESTIKRILNLAHKEGGMRSVKKMPITLSQNSI